MNTNLDKRRTPFLVSLFPPAVMLIICVGWQPISAQDKDDVLFKGKPATFWLKQLKDRDASFRLESVKALRAIGSSDEAVILALVKALDDEDVPVKEAAFDAIKGLPIDGCVSSLCKILRSKNKASHHKVIMLLGGFGPKAKDALPDLTKALEDSDPTIRSLSASKIGDIGTNDSATAALAKLLNDKEKVVRLASTKSLAKLGTKANSATQALVLRLNPETEPDAGIRQETVKAISAVGLRDDKAFIAILEACHDLNDDVRTLAESAVLVVNPKIRVPALAKCAMTNKKVRSTALEYIQQYSNPESDLAEVIELLKSDDEDLRNAGISIFGKKQERPWATASAIIPLLQEKAFRLHASKALGSIGSEARMAFPSLMKLLDEDDDSLRATVLVSLCKIGPENGVFILGKFNSLKTIPVDKNFGLNLYDAPQISTNDLATIMNRTRLTSLTLSHENKITDDGIKNMYQKSDAAKHRWDENYRQRIQAPRRADIPNGTPLALNQNHGFLYERNREAPVHHEA